MKKIEVVEVIEAIITFYPGTFKIDSVEETANAWYLFLKDCDKDIVMLTLKEHIKTNKFPPAISDLLAIENGRYIPNRIKTLELTSELLELKQSRLSEQDREKESGHISHVLKEIVNNWKNEGQKQ